jgi:gluconate kinase
MSGLNRRAKLIKVCSSIKSKYNDILNQIFERTVEFFIFKFY